MIKEKAELLESLRGILGDKVTSDESITLIEDISDSLSVVGEVEEWKKKYEETDREWRAKYTKRFFEPSPDSNPETILDEKTKEIKTYDDLFEEVK